MFDLLNVALTDIFLLRALLINWFVNEVY